MNHSSCVINKDNIQPLCEVPGNFRHFAKCLGQPGNASLHSLPVTYTDVLFSLEYDMTYMKWRY